jgi:hypothetical protein
MLKDYSFIAFELVFLAITMWSIIHVNEEQTKENQIINSKLDQIIKKLNTK